MAFTWEGDMRQPLRHILHCVLIKKIRCSCTLLAKFVEGRPIIVDHSDVARSKKRNSTDSTFNRCARTAFHHRMPKSGQALWQANVATVLNYFMYLER